MSFLGYTCAVLHQHCINFLGAKILLKNQYKFIMQVWWDGNKLKINVVQKKEQEIKIGLFKIN